ncbi:hypothetical protein [Actinacidiphila glaucinigra]|uniref:Uncharacterized protein n=1 Tax=Actinacidiphila glaucinigra TaxID=235986 RepID=A0A239LVU8_9ACTN|nr:hypothetical protein [Actinacidiphila glaucinigra]SNT34646.1 hypothetical protein SAMN05216252_121138 [Actinacidiphila glaucinigra]
MSTVESDLIPPPDGHTVDVVLTGPVDQVARVRAWIQARATEGSSMLLDLPEGGIVRYRMRLTAPTEE